MKFLNDTCVFINKITKPELLFDIVVHYEKICDKFYVTDCIMEELLRISKIEDEKGKIAVAIFNVLKNYNGKNRISIIEIDKNEIYSKNLKDIRNNYYGHLYDRLTLKSLVDSGRYTNGQAKNLCKKDMGECTCLAIAMEEPENFIIVSQDRGGVTLKPNTNIFKIFERSHKIRVWDYDQWDNETRFSKSKKNKNKNIKFR